MENGVIIESVQWKNNFLLIGFLTFFFFHTSCLPVWDGLEFHGCVLDHRIGAPDVDQALVIGAYPGVGPSVLDVASQ